MKDSKVMLHGHMERIQTSRDNDYKNKVSNWLVVFDICSLAERGTSETVTLMFSLVNMEDVTPLNLPWYARMCSVYIERGSNPS